MRFSSVSATNADGISMPWPNSRNQNLTPFNRCVDALRPPARLVKLLLAYPLMPVKLLMGIHWEALMLRLKGTHPRPEMRTLPCTFRPASRLLGVAAQ
ncbi:MAG: DUF1365 family protein [Devosia sp.]